MTWEQILPQSLQIKTHFCRHLHFTLWDLKQRTHQAFLDLWMKKQQDINLWFQTAKFVVISYNKNKKLIQMVWLLLRIKEAILSILSFPLESQPRSQEKSHLISCCTFPFLKSMLSYLPLLRSLIEASRLITSNTQRNSQPEAGTGQAVD